MASFTYTLCALTALMCAFLLLRGFIQTRLKVLFWSGLCFAGLAASNAVLVLDKLVFTEIDLLPYRLWIAVTALALLLVGLVGTDE